MLNTKTITQALYDVLDAAGLTAEYDIERCTRLNFDPARCPWVGIYPSAATSSPHRMGGAQWLARFDVQIVVQTSSFEGNGQNASDDLEVILEAIEDTINADLTLGVTGCRVIGFGREYGYVLYDENGNGDLFMPQAIIKLSIEANVS